MAYFITDDNAPKGKDPNINMISGIHKIKGKTSVNILVSNYTFGNMNPNLQRMKLQLEPPLSPS